MRSVGSCWLIVAAAFSLASVHAQGVTTSGKVRHARNVGELVASFEFTLYGILTEAEKEHLEFLDPEGTRKTDPELYEKVSQNIRRWTEDWLEYAEAELETVPPERLQSARRKAERVDELMKGYFAEHGWPYRNLRAVFLPQRLFFDERRRYGKTLGVFIPFYPDVLFSTVDPFAPLEYILIHENLHYNAKSGAYGPRFVEGLTDAGARYLVAKYGLLGAAELRATQTYVQERNMVDVLCRRVSEVTGQTEEQALETLLTAYLTDDDDALTDAFGERAWAEIAALSWTSKWRKSDILRILDLDERATTDR